MSTTASTESTYPYYDGQGLPFGALSPEKFEEFVFASLTCIQDGLGLQITGRPSGSGDGGFDVQAKVLTTGRLCCIQCKRYEKPLDTGTVIQELAKVAAVSAIEGGDVGEHRFICSNKVRNNLRKQLREAGLEKLAIQAGEYLSDPAALHLENLRRQLNAKGMDPHAVAVNYVRGLDALVVWDMAEFNSALSIRWDSVLQVVERYFRIAAVVREHPRAYFDRQSYFKQYSHFLPTLEPRVFHAELPHGISTSTDSAAPDSANEQPHHVHQLSESAAGKIAVIIGEGGIGKSTALKFILAHTIRSSTGSVLPILVSLANYAPGSLDRLIHQELGVLHGYWRALPDHVLLLCDGLNECPADHMPSFLDELKAVLRSGRVACIIATRDAIRQRKVALPVSQVTCLKLAPLTPNGVRRLALNGLPRSEVAAFLSSYRALADVSHSSHLWTPFAAKVAIKLWNQEAVLPSTLGKMIETVLHQRTIRNSDLDPLYMDSQVIRQLAAALAFELLIVNRRLECDPLVAGRWIRTSKQYCQDALGIVELSDRDVVTLLTRYEVFQTSANGTISFGHQLIAGSFAAVLLAKNWRDYVTCLGDPVTDDAWVFAASLVDTSDVPEYLKRVLETDLMLGARAAREVDVRFHREVENLLSQAVTPGRPEDVRIRGMYALGTLGTATAITSLRALAVDSNREISFQARCAIAAAGDKEFLKRILDEVDDLRAGPMRHSGGVVSIWESASLPLKLDLARERLMRVNPGGQVNESLLLLAHEMDPGDADLIELHLTGARDMIACHVGLYALHQVAPQRAIHVIDGKLAELIRPLDRVRYVRAAGSAGINLDADLLLQTVVLSGIDDGGNDELAREQDALIRDVILRTEVAQELIQRVEAELPSSFGKERERLWEIATGCPSTTIAKYAADAVREWCRDDDALCACRFFVQQKELARQHHVVLITACEQQLRKNIFDAWKTWLLFQLIGVLGFNPTTIAYLRSRIHQVTRIRVAIEQGEQASLPSADVDLLNREAGGWQDHAKYTVERMIAQLVDAAEIAKTDLLPEDLLPLLHTRASTYGFGNAQAKMISGLSDAMVDAELLRIRDFWTQLSVLAEVCIHGATTVRVTLLQKALREKYTIPSALKELTQVVNSCWSSEMLGGIVDEVALIKSWQDGQHYFWDFATAVARRVSHGDEVVIQAAIGIANSPFGKRVLNWWLDCASGGRLGLARLE